jgi:pyruvate kinase
MRIIATLPPPQNALSWYIASHPLVDEVRFNIGARTPYSEKETLLKILDMAKDKTVWLDVKGKQLRITRWAVPTYGDIVLNHKVRVDLPAVIIFRDGEQSNVVGVKGNKIYVDPPPPKAVGAGQAVNIHSRGDVYIENTLTKEDERYLAAAKKVGLTNLMISFVECNQDIFDATDLCPVNEIVAKIESPKGMNYVNSLSKLVPKHGFHLMAARDDLHINTQGHVFNIIEHLKAIIAKDPEAILASRLFESLVDKETPSLPDISDVVLMLSMGYKNFMFGDRVCLDQNAFDKAVTNLKRIMEKWECQK